MLDSLIRYYSNGNKARFASTLGISPQALSMWIVRKSFDAELIYTKCDSVSAQWLLSEKGDMVLKQQPESSSNNDDKKFYQEQIRSLMNQIQELAAKYSQLEEVLLEVLKKDSQHVGNPKQENIG